MVSPTEYFLCLINPPNKTTPLRCHAYMSSQHVITLKSLVTISILIVRGKMLHQKRGSYEYVLPLKNWVDWTTIRREKTVTSLKMYILGRSAHKLKNIVFPFMITFYDFVLKIETSWAKKDFKLSLETWNVNDVIGYVWYMYFQIKKSKIWNVKKNKCSKFTIKN